MGTRETEQLRALNKKCMQVVSVSFQELLSQGEIPFPLNEAHSHIKKTRSYLCSILGRYPQSSTGLPFFFLLSGCIVLTAKVQWLS